MRKINVCVVLPEGYMPAYALVELGELIFYSIQELGYLVKLQFNNIEPDAQNILIGCHMLPVKLIPQVPENTIVVNTEQIHSGVPDWN